MTERAKSFQEVINLWRDRKTLAEDISDDRIEVTHHRVNVWYHRDTLPPGVWNRVCVAARRRKLPVVLKDLSHIAEQQLMLQHRKE